MEPRVIYRKVARLHISSISQGFLPQLGETFLALMYRAIDESDDAALFTSFEDERLVGFVSGAIGMKPVYKQMLRRLPQLACALAPSLIRPSRLKRLVEIFRYDGDAGSTITGLPGAELLSLAVDPAFRGRHIADGLYRELTDFFARRGEGQFRVTVGKALAPAHSFYQRMGAIPAGETQVHRGESSLVYVQSTAAS